MKKIYNNFIPFKGFKAMNFFGILFVRNPSKLTKIDENHEEIHTKQMKELLFLFFYLFYGFEWLIKLFYYKFNSKKAYRNISFEREAYNNQNNLEYLDNRKHYNWFKLIKDETC